MYHLINLFIKYIFSQSEYLLFFFFVVENYALMIISIKLGIHNGSMNENEVKIQKIRDGLPLSEVIRPSSLKDYIGQQHLINDNNGSIKNFIKLGYLPSMIIFGPPGVGKTTIARILSHETQYVFVEISATDSTVQDLKNLSIEISLENKLRASRHEMFLKVAIFVDEIHRLTKTQQDFLLPFIEDGNFVFIGATTVDPKKRIRRAILSRCQMFELSTLNQQELTLIIKRAILFENIRRKLTHQLQFLHYEENSLSILIQFANGDTRSVINLIELISNRFNNDTYKIDNGGLPISLDLNNLKSVVDNIIKVKSGLQNPSNIPFFIQLFDSMRGRYKSKDIQADLIKWTPVTRKINPHIVFKKSVPGCFMVKIRSNYLKSKINDSEIESEFEDENDFIKAPIATQNQKQQEWQDHMVYSDDSDVEPSSIYSDDDDDVKFIDLKKISSSKFNSLAAIHAFLTLLRNGESPIFILKQLLLFLVLFVKSDNYEIRKTLSVLKSIQISNTNITKVMSDLIIRLASLSHHNYKHSNYPLTILRWLKEFHTQHQKSTELQITLGPEDDCEITYDPSLVKKLLSDIDQDEADQIREESGSNLGSINVESIDDLDNLFYIGIEEGHNVTPATFEHNFGVNSMISEVDLH